MYSTRYLVWAVVIFLALYFLYKNIPPSIIYEINNGINALKEILIK
jgi:hypothetical protein